MKRLTAHQYFSQGILQSSKFNGVYSQLLSLQQHLILQEMSWITTLLQKSRTHCHGTNTPNTARSGFTAIVWNWDQSFILVILVYSNSFFLYGVQLSISKKMLLENVAIFVKFYPWCSKKSFFVEIVSWAAHEIFCSSEMCVVRQQDMLIVSWAFIFKRTFQYSSPKGFLHEWIWGLICWLNHLNFWCKNFMHRLCDE